MNDHLLILGSDYPTLSLTRIGAPVKIIEKIVLDIRVVEGIQGIIEEEEEPMLGTLVSEEELVGVIDD